MQPKSTLKGDKDRLSNPRGDLKGGGNNKGLFLQSKNETEHDNDDKLAKIS